MSSKRKSKKAPAGGGEKPSKPLIPEHVLPEGARAALKVAQAAFAKDPPGLSQAVGVLRADDPGRAHELAGALALLARKIHPPVDDHGRREEGSSLGSDRRAVIDAAIQVAEQVCLLAAGPLRSTVEGIVEQSQRYAQSLHADVPPRADWLVVLGLGLFKRCRSLTDMLRAGTSETETDSSMAIRFGLPEAASPATPVAATSVATPGEAVREGSDSRTVRDQTRKGVESGLNATDVAILNYLSVQTERKLTGEILAALNEAKGSVARSLSKLVKRKLIHNQKRKGYQITTLGRAAALGKGSHNFP